MGMPATPQSGASILVQCLINHGVDVVFAYPGGASMPIHQALTQVNGKLRDTLTAPKGAPKEALEEMALASEKIARVLDGKPPRKVIVVPDRLVNLVA